MIQSYIIFLVKNRNESEDATMWGDMIIGAKILSATFHPDTLKIFPKLMNEMLAHKVDLSFIFCLLLYGRLYLSASSYIQHKRVVEVSSLNTWSGIQFYMGGVEGEVIIISGIF